MDQMESTSNEKTTSLKNSILSRYDEVYRAHTSGLKNVNEKITADCEEFLQYYEDRCSEMDALSKTLQQKEYEVKKKEVKLQKEKIKQELKKTLGERLSSWKQLVNESYTCRKVAEGLKSELDMLQKRRSELEEQLKAESFESLQSEIIQLETALLVIEANDLIHLQEKLKILQRKLIEKDEQLQELKDQQNSYRLAIEGKNDELQEARWELIDGLKTYPIAAGIGTKRMGLVDSTPFYIGCNYTEKKANATKFASLCKHLVEDPDWHPFTAVTVGSDKQEIIDEEDEKMVILKAECNEEQYRAVVRALVERNRYRKSGREQMEELWNYKENREASLREGIDHVLKEWNIHKQRN